MKFLIAFLTVLFLSASAVSQPIPPLSNTILRTTTMNQFDSNVPVVPFDPRFKPIGEFYHTTVDSRWYLFTRADPGVNNLGKPPSDFFITSVNLECGLRGTSGGPVLYTYYSNPSPTSAILIMSAGYDASKIQPHLSTPECPFDITTLPQLVFAIANRYIYVNVRTVGYPSGFLRGQLYWIPPGE